MACAIARLLFGRAIARHPGFGHYNNQAGRGGAQLREPSDLVTTEDLRAMPGYVRRKKVASGRTCYQLVVSERAGPGMPPRQRLLAYLGEFATVERALARLNVRLSEEERQAASCRASAQALLARHRAELERTERYLAARQGRQPDPAAWQADAVTGPSGEPRREAARYGRALRDAEAHERRAARLRQRLAKLRPFAAPPPAEAGARSDQTEE
jgi:hypothetical protein